MATRDGRDRRPAAMQAEAGAELQAQTMDQLQAIAAELGIAAANDVAAFGPPDEPETWVATIEAKRATEAEEKKAENKCRPPRAIPTHTCHAPGSRPPWFRRAHWEPRGFFAGGKTGRSANACGR